MTIDTFCLGQLDTNSYVVTSDDGTDCWVFDCPGKPEAMLEFLSGQPARPRGLFLTHAHVDHMAGLNDFRRTFPAIPVFQHQREETWLADPAANLSEWMGAPVTAAPAEGLVSEGELTIGSWKVQVLHLPGHSPGSVGFWFPSEKELISGDVLFRSGVGRWDFPGCDRDDLRRSLKRITELPDETRIRPGHGGTTTIAREKASNVYLRSDDPWTS
jgi:glyoxylase-like metal-dependent hydrolase (beta-lactamase superfamily II)